ncbi:hypothetical protein GCM10010274_39600 [Streptomyces lavendofoliae]|uniref:Uncharacterized protein n=1 Tax=Streptomyces lavendofoliae TaxID=67314 RepID=A0A918HZE9_9ACTN|nr:hypothetical protein GCM10010274_39600 [Streptomyces lavendofoliae]
MASSARVSGARRAGEEVGDAAVDAVAEPADDCDRGAVGIGYGPVSAEKRPACRVVSRAAPGARRSSGRTEVGAADMKKLLRRAMGQPRLASAPGDVTISAHDDVSRH